MRQSSFFGFDVTLFIATIILMTTGILFVYSSGVTATGEVYSNDYIRQIIWTVTGIVILLGFSLFNYNRLRGLSLYVYFGCIILLLITLIIGREVNGAKSWIGIGELGIQPSEFMKIATILFLANYLVYVGGRIHQLRFFLLALLSCLFPVFIILLQPDMGTALVYFPIFIVMTFIAGARIRHIVFLTAAGIIVVILSVLPSFERSILGEEFPIFSAFTDTRILLFLMGSLFIILLASLWGYLVFKKKYFYWVGYTSLMIFVSILGSLLARHILKDYQIMRLMIFLNPYIDPKGAGWNIIQSVTAIGSGGFSGKGFLMGTQSHYNYLPQQSTDFIFSILAEEWGFLGGFVVILLFLVIILRAIRILTHAKDNFAILIGAGVVAMIFFHALINIGMTMGIMPVTGIPLFFLSHGGSSLWTASIGIGILLNIYVRRYRYLT
jgi:rod shape determining protein RodA